MADNKINDKSSMAYKSGTLFSLLVAILVAMAVIAPLCLLLVKWLLVVYNFLFE